MHATPQKNRLSGFGRGRSARTSGFSLTELLVVIAIIVLLIGLLLAALAQVQKKTRKTQTEATMQQFINACAVFQSEHGFYPGVIPDAVLQAHAAANGGTVPISGTENALLHLMGGYRVLSPADAQNLDGFIHKDYDNYASGASENSWEITFDGGAQGEWKLKIKTVASDGGEVAQLGEGPFINGKPYPPYFTPDKNSLVRLRKDGGPASGQIGEESDGLIPDLVDAWGQPIIYVRQTRDRGPLVKDPAVPLSLPQFDLAGLTSYVNSKGIGEQVVDQSAKSILAYPGGTWDDTDQQRKVMSVVLNNQSFYKGAPAGTAPYYGKARGAVMLLSAGPDGVYLSSTDGPGSNSNPLDGGAIDSDIIAIGPRVLEEFDDIRVYGGG